MTTSGGTDVAPCSELYGGHVLNATISLFTHCHIERITFVEPGVQSWKSH